MHAYSGETCTDLARLKSAEAVRRERSAGSQRDHAWLAGGPDKVGGEQMDGNRLIAQVLQNWQAIGTQGLWHQDAFLLFMCVLAVVILFFTGTVIGLFTQSLWSIFISSHQATDGES
jgi:hypothetical protein